MNFLSHLGRLKSPLHLKLDDRLPAHILGPCELTCDWDLDASADFSILHLKLKGSLTIRCQRCGEIFTLPFVHENKIALCKNEAELERLMPEMDCLLQEELPAHLEELITDELHLYSPEKHENGPCTTYIPNM